MTLSQLSENLGRPASLDESVADSQIQAMAVAVQKIQDPEAEARELDRVLKAVGKSLKISVKRPGKTGMTYSQFKAKAAKKAR